MEFKLSNFLLCAATSCHPYSSFNLVIFSIVGSVEKNVKKITFYTHRHIFLYSYQFFSGECKGSPEDAELVINFGRNDRMTNVIQIVDCTRKLISEGSEMSISKFRTLSKCFKYFFLDSGHRL